MYFIHHPDCLLHDMGAWHPERPARLNKIRDYLVATGRMGLLRVLEAPRVSEDAVLRVHTRAHVDRLERLAAHATADAPAVIDSDTMVMPSTMDAARGAAGAVQHAVDRVLADAAAGGQNAHAFCAGRPPGHHATPTAAMGFCFLNNVAIGAAHAREAHGCRRVAIVDFDVHHGNGTEAFVAGKDGYLFMSAFQHPFYPPVPDTPPADNVVHIKLPAGTGSKAYREAIAAHLLPPLEAYQPDLLLLSAGFDGHAADPYANWALHEDDYGWLTTRLLDVTDCPVVSVLEGGYDLAALARSVAAHVDALL
jgi:acetoin utilization deacetylase AcuC-like enzyme